MAQDDAKNVRPTTLAVAVNQKRALAEIDLHFLAWPALQPPKRQWRLRAQPGHETPHAVVLMVKAMLADKVLPDALSPWSSLLRMISRNGAHWLASLTAVVHCEHSFRSDVEAGPVQSLSASS